ncbi:LysR family transcriptional regulator [Curvibacter sp. CHRR-16]|uniref:LysR family transcriptional regulator n=1 Tax=Curvibacter sp. CHRR-16 TaxID=2835872 RepID=UPI001BDAA390|nr:LysR family transcriptional regulator [Curvibacter sp. CHRR-16]MBT0570292.1 LysR family transcriptional regulator [Curvibacter sp. CHRR-16]
MNTTPDIKLLRIFATVARHQGFAKAQQELNLTLPAISTYMGQLEEQLGFKLCERGRGGFALTPKGELILAEALHLLGAVDGFGAYAASVNGDLSGSLKLGVLDATVTDHSLPLRDAIGEFCQRYPAVHLSLLVRNPFELQEGVLHSELDMAVGFFPSRTPGLVFQPLHREQQWLYCSDRHPLFNARHITEPLVRSLSVVRRSYWSQSELSKHGFARSAATVDSMEAQLILILSGGYVGYLPEHYAQPWVDKGQLRVLLPAAFGYQSPFALATRRGRNRELPIQAMRSLLLGQLGVKKG